MSIAERFAGEARAEARYVGPRTVLEINLSSESTRRYELDDADFADALGGVGLAVLLLDRYFART